MHKNIYVAFWVFLDYDSLQDSLTLAPQIKIPSSAPTDTSHLSPPFLRHLFFLLSLSLIGWLWFLRSPMVVEDRGGASYCGGGLRWLGSVNPPFFFFLLSSPYLHFFSQTPHLNSFSHRLNQNIFIFGWFFAGICWTVSGGQGYRFVQVWFMGYGWWLWSGFARLIFYWFVFDLFGNFGLILDLVWLIWVWCLIIV